MLLDHDVGTVFAKVGGHPSDWPPRMRHLYVRHLLRRAAVPLLPLMMCLSAVAAGELNAWLYAAVVVPMWHFLNNMLLFYPFCVLYPKLAFKWNSKPLLVMCSLFAAIFSFIEAMVAVQSPLIGYAVGNTLMGSVGVVGVPVLVYLRGVKVKDDRDGRGSGGGGRRNRRGSGASSTMTVAPGGSGTGGSPPRVPASRSGSGSSSFGGGSSHDGSSSDGGGHSGGDASNEGARLIIEAQSAARRRAQTTSQAKMRINMSGSDVLPIILSAATLVFTGAVMWMSYLATDLEERHFYWRLLSLILPPQIILVARDWSKPLTYSFPYAVFYTVVVLRMPDFLGHLALHVFGLIESTARGQTPEWVSMVKFSLSVGYVTGMALYFMMLSRVTSMMCEANIYPRFLFMPQVFYYFFWYLLLGSESVYDWLFWAMLLLMNANYIMGSTGMYLDLLRGAVPCTGAINSCLGPVMPNVAIKSPSGRWSSRPASPFIGVDASMARHRGSAMGLAAMLQPQPPSASASVSFGGGGSNSSGDGGGSGGGSGGAAARSLRGSRSMMARKGRAPSLRSFGAATSVASSIDNTPRDAALVGLNYQEREAVRQLLFRVKLAEQDTLADLVCLVLVPSLITAVAMLGTDDGDGHGMRSGIATARIALPQLWMRFLCMAIMRTISARVSRAVFARKFKSEDDDGRPGAGSGANGVIEEGTDEDESESSDDASAADPTSRGGGGAADASASAGEGAGGDHDASTVASAASSGMRSRGGTASGADEPLRLAPQSPSRSPSPSPRSVSSSVGGGSDSDAHSHSHSLSLSRGGHTALEVGAVSISGGDAPRLGLVADTAAKLGGPSPFYSATMADLRDCFTYYVIAVTLCAFSCFQQPDIPARFAFWNAHL